MRGRSLPRRFRGSVRATLDLPTLKLLAFWAAVGALLYASGRIAHRRRAGGVEHAEES